MRSGNLIKQDSDRVYITDGRERTGKSVFTFQQAKYLDPTFNIDRICFTPESFLKQIRTAPQGSVVVFDEAFRGLSSKASQSKVNKKIVQAMMEMGQRNLIVFIVLPTIFLLELYPAVLRSEALFHIYKDKNGQRQFKLYNYAKKSRLYMNGKKKGFSYAFPTSKFHGKFFGKYAVDEKAYRKKKLRSLQDNDIISEEIKEEQISKFKLLVYRIRQNKQLSYKKLEEYFKKELNFQLTARYINEICMDVEKNLKIEAKIKEKVDYEPLSYGESVEDYPLPVVNA